MKFNQPDSVTVPFEPGVAPCSKSSYHPREDVKGRYLTPVALSPSMILIVLPLDEVIATGCAPFEQTASEGLCSIIKFIYLGEHVPVSFIT